MVDNNNNNIINMLNNQNSSLLKLIMNRDRLHQHDHDDESNNNGSSSAKEHHQNLLPIANVGRMMKQILPANAKVSKEAKETMQECATEFVSFVTGEASERCRRERRKTINGDDLCWALQTLGFDHYAGPLRQYLQAYRLAEDARASRANDNDAQN